MGQLRFHQERIFEHATLRINYTSYDVRREYDTINPSTPSRFVMLPADRSQDPTSHRFLYVKVIGIFHANVKYQMQPPRRMDFVRVRWLDYDYNQPAGWEELKLDRVGYQKCRADADVLNSFDFINPADIVRSCHLIPDFRAGIDTNLLRGPTSMSWDNDLGDWRYYYVNR